MISVDVLRWLAKFNINFLFQAGISAAPTRALSVVKNMNLPQQIKDKLPELPQAIKDLKL